MRGHDVSSARSVDERRSIICWTSRCWRTSLTSEMVALAGEPQRKMRQGVILGEASAKSLALGTLSNVEAQFGGVLHGDILDCLLLLLVMVVVPRGVVGGAEEEEQRVIAWILSKNGAGFRVSRIH